MLRLSPQRRLRLRQLWHDYLASRSDRDLHGLAVEYLDFIRGIATRLARRLPHSVDCDDLVQAGFLGLRRAIQSFDEAHNTQFTTFATRHVQGAMLDSIRAADPAPRAFRKLAARLADARQQLAQSLGRNPTDDELAAHLDLPADRIRRHARDAQAITILPLHGLARHPEQPHDSLPADRRVEDPATAALRADIQNQFTHGFEKQERLILILYYYEALTMREIGATLDISESRVSQIHSSLLARLKARLLPPQPPPAATPPTPPTTPTTPPASTVSAA